MSRLTNDLRSDILNAATKNLFAAEFTALKEREKKIGDKVFFKHYAKPEQYAAMERLPAEFFSSGEEIRCWLNGESAVISMSESRRFPAFGVNRRLDITDSALRAEWDKLEKERKALSDKKKELSDQINGVIASATTVKKLLEVWPESKPFIPDYAFATGGTKNLPAVMVANLNAAMVKAGVPVGVGQ